MAYSSPVRIIIKNTSQSEGMDKTGTEWFRWTVSIDTDPKEFIDEIKFVKYHLHQSFPTAEIEINDKRSGFKLISKGWGEFTIRVEITRNDDKKTIVNHYLSLAETSDSESHQTITSLRESDFK